MTRLIKADALANYANNQKDKTVDANDIMRFPVVDAIPIEWMKQKAIESNEPFGPYMTVMYAWFDHERREQKNGNKPR